MDILSLIGTSKESLKFLSDILNENIDNVLKHAIERRNYEIVDKILNSYNKKISDVTAVEDLYHFFIYYRKLSQEYPKGSPEKKEYYKKMTKFIPMKFYNCDPELMYIFGDYHKKISHNNYSIHFTYDQKVKSRSLYLKYFEESYKGGYFKSLLELFRYSPRTYYQEVYKYINIPGKLNMDVVSRLCMIRELQQDIMDNHLENVKNNKCALIILADSLIKTELYDYQYSSKKQTYIPSGKKAIYADPEKCFQLYKMAYDIGVKEVKFKLILCCKNNIWNNPDEQIKFLLNLRENRKYNHIIKIYKNILLNNPQHSNFLEYENKMNNYAMENYRYGYTEGIKKLMKYYYCKNDELELKYTELYAYSVKNINVYTKLIR